MAILCDASTDGLSNTSPGITGAELYSWAVWLYRTATPTVYGAVYSLNTNDEANNFNIDAVLVNGSNQLLSYVGDGVDSGFSGNGTTLAANTWYYVAGINSSLATNGFKIYLNGVLDTQNAYVRTGRTAAFTREEMANNYTSNNYAFTGRYFNFMRWNRVLTASEIAYQMKRFEPIYPGDLRLWTPMRARNAARKMDMVRGGYWTADGTLTDAQDPTIVSNRRIFYFPLGVAPVSSEITGSLSATLGTLVSSSSGNVDVTGTLTLTLSTASTSGAGNVDIEAVVSKTLSTLQLSGVGDITLTGSLAATLGNMVLASGGLVDVDGSLGSTLASLTGSSAGQVDISGALGITLAALTSAGAGEVSVIGALVQTLAIITLSSGGSVTITGELLQTLGFLVLSASGGADLGIEASLSQTLANLLVTSSGTVAINGIMQAVLNALTLSGSGSVNLSGSLTSSLGAVTSLSTGDVTITGTLNQVLSSLLVASSALAQVEGFSRRGLVEVEIRKTAKADDETFTATIRRNHKA